MNRNYISGRTKEYAVCKELRRQGAVFAQRTAGSHSPIDVVALMPDGSVRLIQVKRSSYDPKAAEKLSALPHTEGVLIELWEWVRGAWQIS